ncbi:MAG: ImmA/IrrE family metallo-endopeptidase [Pusillimonas sp.]
MNNLKPFKSIGPGDVIKDEMEFYGWSQKDLAEILNISEKHISQILSNSVPISSNMARLLSSTFKQSPEFWINLDAQYRRNFEFENQFDETAVRAEIFKSMPIRDMQKKGWLPKKKEDLFAAVKEFWEITELDFSFLKERANACFRKSEAFSSKFNAFFAQTWLRKVETEAKKQKNVPKYSKTKLKKLADEMARYSTLENGIPDFIEELKKTGVVFLLIPHLEKTFTDGAASWVNTTNPVIALTGRYKRNDNFWFTLAHEIGHVLLHEKTIKTSAFIDSIDNPDLLDRTSEEEEANDFAGRVLKHEEICRYFVALGRISGLRVEECARKLEIHPGVIVGFLQHEKKLSYRNLNDYKICIETILSKI